MEHGEGDHAGAVGKGQKRWLGERQGNQEAEECEA